jgi:hypothetical protein
VLALGEEMAQRDAILAEAAAAREAQILQATAQAETARARGDPDCEMLDRLRDERQQQLLLLDHHVQDIYKLRPSYLIQVRHWFRDCHGRILAIDPGRAENEQRRNPILVHTSRGSGLDSEAEKKILINHDGSPSPLSPPLWEQKESFSWEESYAMRLEQMVSPVVDPRRSTDPAVVLAPYGPPRCGLIVVVYEDSPPPAGAQS